MGDKVIIQCEQAHLDLVFPTFFFKKSISLFPFKALSCVPKSIFSG